jgi:hypothetical protein
MNLNSNRSLSQRRRITPKGCFGLRPTIVHNRQMAGLLRTTAIQSVKLLHHRRRSANRKLHCGIALVWQSPLWAVNYPLYPTPLPTPPSSHRSHTLTHSWRRHCPGHDQEFPSTGSQDNQSCAACPSYGAGGSLSPGTVTSVSANPMNFPGLEIAGSYRKCDKVKSVPDRFPS